MADDCCPDDLEMGSSDVGSDATAAASTIRQRALAAAVTAYTAAHGHPLDHPPMDGEDVAVRWATRPRVVAAAALVLLLMVGAVAVGTAMAMPREVVTVPLAPAGGSTTDAAASAVGGGPAGAGVDAPAAVAGGGRAAESSGAGPAAGAGGLPAVPPSAGAGPAVDGDLVVHVVGQVGAPGVIGLPTGSRVVDALTAAGGPLPGADLTALNLARVLADGEQVVVPRPGELVAPAPGAASPAPAGTPGPAEPVDLNAADARALDGLPGIGPVLAERIVEHRSTEGPFTTVEELAEVPGIGPALLDRLRGLVRV